jgi:glycosyltransferase involved in cell wall biosynthesis
MMKVAVSLLSFRPGRIGGTETYLRQLITRLPRASREHEITLVMDRDLAAKNIFPGMKRCVIDRSARRIRWERGLEAVSPYRCRAAERAFAGLQSDVVLFPQQSIFPKRVRGPCVLVVHDLHHVFLPRYLSPLERRYRQRNYAYSLSRADRIIAISRFTQKTILEQCRLDPRRISVIPHGYELAPTAVSGAAPDVGGRYIYYPAVTRPHKNHRTLFESIAALKSQGRFDYQLVLSGIQTSYWNTLRKDIQRLKLAGTVQHVGYVSYERVSQLYEGAECVVFPTLFEGFGLPILEAFEHGKKIVVSRLELFDELGVPQQFQIDFSDPEQLYHALEQPRATELAHRPWTWDETAAATLSLLESAAARQTSAEVLVRAA